MSDVHVYTTPAKRDGYLPQKRERNARRWTTLGTGAAPRGLAIIRASEALASTSVIEVRVLAIPESEYAEPWVTWSARITLNERSGRDA